MPTSLSRVATPHVAPGTTTGQARVASGPETRPVVLYVSAVADNKGGAETVLLEMLRNPFVIPHLAVPGHGVLRETALRHGIPVHLFDLGAVAQVRRPPSLADILGTARDAVRAAMAEGSLDPARLERWRKLAREDAANSAAAARRSRPGRRGGRR